VLAADEPGRPWRVLSLGEAKWDKIMTVRHLDRLRRARDLFVGERVRDRAHPLAWYSGAGFDASLLDAARADGQVRLVGLGDLH
jgi:hypothetical protein